MENVKKWRSYYCPLSIEKRENKKLKDCLLI